MKKMFLAIVLGLLVGVILRLLCETATVQSAVAAAYRAHYDRDDIRGAAEFADAAGNHYVLLPTVIDEATMLTTVGDWLAAYKIDYLLYEEKIMVRAPQIPLAMEVLQVAGLNHDAQHFSFSEITADATRDPQRYALQTQLALQNMLGNTIALTADEIIAAQVTTSPTTHTATVRVQLPRDIKHLPAAVVAEIETLVKATLPQVKKVELVMVNS